MRARKSVFQRADGSLPMKYKPRKAPAPTGGYAAQITKTTDGGATWKTVFNVSNQFYVRPLRCLCPTPIVCVFVCVSCVFFVCVLATWAVHDAVLTGASCL